MNWKITSIIGGMCTVVIIAGVLVWRARMEQHAPRTQALDALRQLALALSSPADKTLQDLLVLPSAIRDRTPSEQTEFIRKALSDEVSPEGIKVLAAEGTFGPLSTLFSNEAARWTAAAGVSVSNCVAFRLEKNGVVAEVAIATNGSARVIRCNNVKQMAP